VPELISVDVLLQCTENPHDRISHSVKLLLSKKLGTFEQKARLVRDAIDDLLEADDDLAAMYLTRSLSRSMSSSSARRTRTTGSLTPLNSSSRPLVTLYSKKLGTFEQKARLVRDAIDDLLEADDDLAAMSLFADRPLS
jgi:hypothetical protein